MESSACCTQWSLKSRVNTRNTRVRGSLTARRVWLNNARNLLNNGAALAHGRAHTGATVDSIGGGLINSIRYRATRNWLPETIVVSARLTTTLCDTYFVAAVYETVLIADAQLLLANYRVFCNRSNQRNLPRWYLIGNVIIVTIKIQDRDCIIKRRNWIELLRDVDMKYRFFFAWKGCHFFDCKSFEWNEILFKTLFT